jgi:hypothetical protein
MQHGSLQNLMAANGTGNPAPVVGMGCTLIYWTDRKAATVVRMSKSGKTAWIKLDDARRVDDNGMTDSGQRYEYTPNPDAAERRMSLRKDGRWRTSEGQAVRLGSRDAYFDYSF